MWSLKPADIIYTTLLSRSKLSLRRVTSFSLLDTARDVSRAIPRERRKRRRVTYNWFINQSSCELTRARASARARWCEVLKITAVSLCLSLVCIFSQFPRLNFIDIPGSSWENFITRNCARTVHCNMKLYADKATSAMPSGRSYFRKRGGSSS